MKIKAIIDVDGAFIPVYLYSYEYKTILPIYFILDTGAAVTTVSSSDLRGLTDLSNLKRKKEIAYGVGGVQERYILNNADLYFLTEDKGWIKCKSFPEIGVIPPIYGEQSGEQIFIPSMLGHDILGVDFDMYYLRGNIYLEN